MESWFAGGLALRASLRRRLRNTLKRELQRGGDAGLPRHLGVTINLKIDSGLIVERSTINHYQTTISGANDSSTINYHPYIYTGDS